MLLGILSGLLAGACWGFVFLAPKILTDYSSADIALGRYVVFALVSALLLLPQAKRLRKIISWPLILKAAGLSCLSFSVYYFSLAAAIKYCGVAPSSLVIGLLPVTIPLIAQDKVVSRTLFYLSIFMILCGLLLLNVPVLLNASTSTISAKDWMIGLSLACLSLMLWTAYAPLNARVLSKYPKMDGVTWASMLGVLAFFTMLPIWLIFNAADLFSAPAHFFDMRYIFWMVVIGAVSSWMAIYFWNFASKRLPTALAGQLIVSEVVFSLLYNYIYIWQLPKPIDLTAAIILIFGVMVGVRSFKPKKKLIAS